MTNQTSPSQHKLSADDFAAITQDAHRLHLAAGERVFSEGDDPDYVYFIESGRMSIVIQKFTSEEEIHTLGQGEYFGEMAVLLDEKRTASVVAAEDSVLLRVNKEQFVDILKQHQGLAKQIETLVAARNEELILRENVVDVTGISGRHLHIGIKGDPSLRESAFTRERYQSVVDQQLPQLIPRLKEMLIERSVHQVYVALNSGEVRTLSVFDPFTEEVHPALKLVDRGYLDRHFPVIAYDTKNDMIRGLFSWLRQQPAFSGLPPQIRKLYGEAYTNWTPVPQETITGALDHLSALRDIPDFYLRHFTLSTIRDAIRLQFNCDGTHIVSADDYVTFLKDNLGVDWACEV